MKNILTIIFLLIIYISNSQEYTKIQNRGINNLRLLGDCDTSDLKLKQIFIYPDDYDYLKTNGYCFTISPFTNNISYSFTFNSNISGTIIINSGYSVISCSNITFSNTTLYDNTSCQLVGEGYEFQIVQGHQYTYTLVANATGPFCKGFSTICPYWLDITPLPVTLNEFKAVPENNYINIIWSTLTESNSDYFILYKSLDLINFYPIFKISGQGYSNTVTYYNYKDFEYSNYLVIYYKLIQYDYNGVYYDKGLTYITNTSGLKYKVYDLLGNPTDLISKGFKIIKYENGIIKKQIIY